MLALCEVGSHVRPGGRNLGCKCYLRRLKKHNGPEPTTSLVYRTISSKRVSEAPLLDEREGDKTKTSNSNHEPFSAIGKNSVRGRDVNERGGP